MNWQDNLSAFKYSLFGSAMLLLAGCSSNPRALAEASPTQQTAADDGRKPATQTQPKRPHVTRLARSDKSASIPKAVPRSTLERVTWCARNQQGKLYCWGGSSPKTGFDCSGLTKYAFQQGAGITLPRTAADQYAAAEKVPDVEAKRGDLVFFRTHGKRVSHVGIYLGDNKFIHAPRTGKSITTSQLSGYWKKRLVGFGRVAGACRPMYT